MCRPRSMNHWLGTDEFGRDVLTRIIYGARIALFVGFAASLAAQALGASRWRTMLRHIVPNVMAPYLTILTAQLGGAILTEASLSFLGLGTAEPTPSWGLMLSGSAPSYAEKAPWMAVFPGLAISLAVFGFNLFGDSLRDALDPKLRRG